MSYQWINKLIKNTSVKNFSVLAFGEIIGRGLNMVTNIVLARTLAPERYGVYTMILTYSVIFYTISSLGIGLFS